MNAYQAAIFLQAQACMVRVAAMVAMNEDRAARGLAQAYGEEAFFAEAADIGRCGESLRASA